MARRKKKKTDHDNAPELTPWLRLHLHCLRLGTIEAYLHWCEKNGYDARLDKSDVVLRRELEDWRRRTAIEALKRSRQTRDPASVLAAVARGQLDTLDAPAALRPACKRIALELPTRASYRESLAEMLLFVARRTDFLLERRRFGLHDYPYLDAVIHLHARRRHWIRSLERFRPRTHNRARQFSALARHLFTRYDVPTFLDAAWFRRDEAAPHMRDWFLHIGRGGNLRTACTPVPVTRRIAHHFCQAPPDVTIEGALRWGQIRALGGSRALAQAVLGTTVGDSLANDAFWTSVLRFFAAQEDLDPGEVGPIVDFLRHQKFEPMEVFHNNGRVVERPPPRPHLSMRDRTLPALRLQVDRWHRQLAKETDRAGTWPPSGINPLWDKTGTAAGGNLKLWRIEELRSGGALAYEGRLLRHCVAAYAAGCVRGRYSIWSLSLEVDGLRKRLLTIQVSKGRAIMECSGRNNRPPTEAERRVVLRWAAREELHAGAALRR